MKPKIYRKRKDWDQLHHDLVTQEIYKLEDYWPLSVRQIYYRALSAGLMEGGNCQTSYDKIVLVCKHLRLEQTIPWRAIEDRTRHFTSKRGWSDSESFASTELDNLFEGYSRCMMQNQKYYIEVWVEKSALGSILESVCWPLCIRTLPTVGDPSISILYTYAKRVERYDKKLLILYCGDHDPTGVQIPKSIQKNLYEYFGLAVEFDIFALTPEQIEKYGLDSSFKAKKSDSNYQKFFDEFGTDAYELDALDPPIFKYEIKKALAKYIDPEITDEEKKIQEVEKAKLKELKHWVMDYTTDKAHQMGINLKY